MKIVCLIIFNILSIFSTYSQNKTVDDFLIDVRNYDFINAESRLFELKKDSILQSQCYIYLYLNKNKGIYINKYNKLDLNKKINTDNPYLKAIQLLNSGLYDFYYEKETSYSILEKYLQALSFAKTANNIVLICEVYKKILEYHNNIVSIKDQSYINYYKAYKQMAYDTIEVAIAEYYNVSIDIKNTPKDVTEEQFDKIKDIQKHLPINYFQSNLKTLEGNYYEAQNDFPKAFKLYNDALIMNKNTEFGYEILPKTGAQLNIGVYYYYLKQFNKALYYLKLNKKYNGKLIYRKKIYFDYWKANVFKELKRYDSAYYYLESSRRKQFALNQSNLLAITKDIQEQYDNQKLRNDNLEIESKRKQNLNLLIGALVFITFGTITAFLLQKNTRKKQKLAEQEKALETQKLATVLKEQELVSIDAMIEGQEKERQRIANDLHDDLGGLMATIKLHFNALKDKQTPKLLDKTTSLIDEAYNKIRSIAHAKNSGVIAKQGLLIAIQNMADKISASNKITIDVIDYELDERLENSLELTIFRIVQELITNVIKHAEANEATIHLTNHENSLNIMIEDNGKGFNPNQITTKNKGMGISSIDKRVEYLNGTMTIESEHKKGTTIIIDIPI